MLDSLVKELTALYNGGDISGFIVSRFFPESLVTEWFKQGITHKMIPSNLTEKETHELYIIPGDRAGRFALNLDVLSNGYSLLLILGQLGLTKPKFVVFVGPHTSNNAFDIIWQTKNQSLLDIARIVSHHLLDDKSEPNAEEPNFDYIEQMRNDVIDGLLACAIAVEIPRKPAEVGNIVAKAKGASESEKMPIIKGDFSSIIPLSKIFSRWVPQLKLMKKIKNGIAACIIFGPKDIRMAIWDIPRALASFAIQNSRSLFSLVQRYLMPLWTEIKPATSSIVKPRASDAAVSSVERSKFEELIVLLERKLEKIDIDGLQAKILAFENRLAGLEQTLSKKGDGPSTPSSVDAVTLQKFRNLVTRLEAIAERLDTLEDNMREIANEGA